MINIESRNRGKSGNEAKSSELVTWLRCSICGEPLPLVTWSDLLYKKTDLCEKRKNCKLPFHHQKDDILACINRGAAYWRPVPAKPCREKGITNCTECPYDACIIPLEELGNLY